MKLLECARSSPRPFDAVLVDDTSRLSRNLADAARIFERLNFTGITIVAVSQGIDSRNEQADVLVAVHGLVDALDVKELAKKTHRGLEGRMLRGLHVGGRCFGYRIVESEEGNGWRWIPRKPRSFAASSRCLQAGFRSKLSRRL